MRLWTLHPKYLDARGLVALWREALLAQKVFQNATSGYRHHPQLVRFRTHIDPQAAIATYLRGVLREAERRGYQFDAQKIAETRVALPLVETTGQLLYEWSHLRAKLRERSPQDYQVWKHLERPDPHPFFTLVPGAVREWERVS